MNNLLLAAKTWEDPMMYITLGILIFLGFVLYYSSRRRKKMESEVTKMHDELRPGKRVRTVGGVVGRIKEIREEAPGFKTVLLETGSAKYPAFMLFDIQAIYSLVAEEGHTLDGVPVPKPIIPTEAPLETEHTTKLNGEELDAREYVEKRNSTIGANDGTKNKSKSSKRK